MSARCRLGEEIYTEAGRTALIPSRPGYGATELAAGPSVPEFVPRLAALCRQQGLSRLTAVGISLGARSALTLAALYPDLVERVILLCPVSFAPWPDPATRRTAARGVQPGERSADLGDGAPFAAARPRAPPAQVDRLPVHAAGARGGRAPRRRPRAGRSTFLLSCRSGRGFLNDLSLRPTSRGRGPADADPGHRRTTVRSSPHHARPAGRATAARALVEVPTASHLLWLGDGSAETARAIRDFLGRLRPVRAGLRCLANQRPGWRPMAWSGRVVPAGAQQHDQDQVDGVAAVVHEHRAGFGGRSRDAGRRLRRTGTWPGCRARRRPGSARRPVQDGCGGAASGRRR